MACRVRGCRAAPSRRNRADSGALAAAPAVHSVAADGRLRVRSASRPLHSQSLSLVGTLSDSSSPSLQGDKVSLHLWGDIILEHLQGLGGMLTRFDAGHMIFHSSGRIFGQDDSGLVGVECEAMDKKKVDAFKKRLEERQRELRFN